jgi:hypothetical protein
MSVAGAADRAYFRPLVDWSKAWNMFGPRQKQQQGFAPAGGRASLVKMAQRIQRMQKKIGPNDKHCNGVQPLYRGGQKRDNGKEPLNRNKVRHMNAHTSKPTEAQTSRGEDCENKKPSATNVIQQCTHTVPSNEFGIFAMHCSDNEPIAPEELAKLIEGSVAQAEADLQEELDKEIKP